MRVGVSLPVGQGEAPDGTPGWDTILPFARHAESLGFDSLWLADHLLFRFPGQPTTGIQEAWSILSALAASTTRVQLGPLVICLSFRNPALVAKMAATTDAISGGRLILGLGAGWHDPEYRAFGYPLDHRVGRFEEGLRIVGPLVRGESVSLSGRFHEVHDAVLAPPPARRIPILVAAKRPRMFRLTARHSDAWNGAWYGAPDERLRNDLGMLDTALAAEERDPTTMTRTVGMNVRDPDRLSPDDARPIAFGGSVDELARALDAYAAIGVDHLIVWLEPKDERSLDRLAHAVRLHRAVAAG